MSREKLLQYISKSIEYIFLVIFIVLSFFSLFHFERYPLGFQHSIFKTVVFCLVTMAILWGGTWIYEKIPFNMRKWIGLGLVGILIIIQFAYFLKTLSEIGWDAQELNNAAIYGMYNGYYFARYPNQLLPFFLLRGWLYTVKWVPFLSSLRKLEILNLIMVDWAILMLYLVAQKMLSKKKAFQVLVIAILLIGFHPTLSTIYTDTLAMPFPIGCILGLVMAKDAKEKREKLCWAVFAGAMIGIGYYIKPTVVIVAIALAIIGIVYADSEILQKDLPSFWGAVVSLCIVLLVIGLALSPIRTKVVEENPGNIPKSMLHFIGLGLSNLEDDPSGYGGWNEPEINWTNDHIKDDNYKQEALEHIWERIKEYGWLGYPEHLFNKLVWAGNDGTFFYGLEGEFHMEEQSRPDSLRGKLQNSLYIETEFYQKWYSSWMQGVWLAICIFCVMAFQKKEFNFWMSTGKLSIIGLFLFLLIFENRSRYLFLYLPILLLVSVQNRILERK